MSTRAEALKRIKQAFIGGASLEHVLGEAYNAGFLDGSSVAHLTDLDLGVLVVLADTTTADVERIRAINPALAERELDRRVAEINADLESI
jgi:hypothetical protein